MRLFYVTSDVPSAGHRPSGAVAIVTHQAATALAEAGHDLVIQPILSYELSEEGRRDLAKLRTDGFVVEDPLLVRDRPPQRLGLVRHAIAGRPDDFFPALRLAEELRERVAGRGSDLVLHVWSPEGLAACSRVEAPVFAYYGNPDHKPIAARLGYPELFDIPYKRAADRLRLRLRQLANERRRRAVIDLMATCRWAANVCAVDADWLVAQGHPNAFYLPNMWSESQLFASPRPENRIIGNIGSLATTGNTFGLAFLGREVVPALERILGDQFVVDVFGGGRPSGAVAAALDHPRIRVRGWAEDIDAEMASAKLFLLANNNHPDFVVGHTRVLHAWSLGCCLVAHAGIADAMPEVVNGENALLGSTGPEIAELAAAALEDESLRDRIASAGLATFRRLFLPRVVVRQILDRVATR